MHAKEICQELDQLQREGAGLDKLLNRAVELLHRSNPRFHWTGIYELFPDNILRLGPFIGVPTDHCFIGVGQGVCGTAVAEKRNMNIPDVSKVSNYLACSTATRSELVVLIRKGETIFAQIDIDSHELAAFDEEAVRLVEKVADWLARIYERHPTKNAAAAHPTKR
ncbi:MAG: GAF domain-containing protein [Limisphaerales bacterium]